MRIRLKLDIAGLTIDGYPDVVELHIAGELVELYQVGHRGNRMQAQLEADEMLVIPLEDGKRLVLQAEVVSVSE